MTTADLTVDRRAQLHRRARLLAWATIGYNTLEGVVAIAAGLAAGSVALVSFGLDSAVEVLSAGAVAWQFGGGSDPETRERRTLRLIAVAFFALAAYVTVESVRALVGAGEPDPSSVGIALAAASVVVMPLLVAAKRRIGRELGSATVVADSTQTLLCTYLSVILLVGLVLNATLGWSWADPLVALLIAAVAVREGVEAWRGDACCDPALGTGETSGEKSGHDCCAH
ncbi:MAG: cation diffusion facilitator family transporter [Actinomycetes bacterium]